MDRVSKKTKEKIKEIVDFYMQYVTDYHSEIEGHLTYHWHCMSNGSIDDYLDIVRERKEKEAK